MAAELKNLCITLREDEKMLLKHRATGEVIAEVMVRRKPTGGGRAFRVIIRSEEGVLVHREDVDFDLEGREA